MPRVPMHLSDLFFNHNLDAAKAGPLECSNVELGFNRDRLKAEAEAFLQLLEDTILENCVVDEVTLPDADDLVADFFGRV